MITILLAVIAGILLIRFLDDVSKGRDPGLHSELEFAVFIAIATVVILAIAWGLNFLFEWFGIYLG